MWEKENVQLCWNCKLTCKGCAWIDKGEEIKGWGAIPTKIYNADTDTYIDSYSIYSCPYFTPEYRKLNSKEIAQILDMKLHQVKATSSKHLKELFALKGLKLKVIKYENTRRFLLKL